MELLTFLTVFAEGEAAGEAAAEAAAGGAMFTTLIYLLLFAAVNFSPLIIALLKRNINCLQIFIVLLIPLVGSIILYIITVFMSSILADGIFVGASTTIWIIWGIVALIAWIIAIMKAIRGY
ncbi:MAG: hypothetical protein IJQ28_01700 [Clostridia bacterium]|nr:hypothetical protein [Clostridia bacterium]